MVEHYQGGAILQVMDIILKKNEAEINEAVAKGLLVVFGMVLLVVIFCWIGIFDIYVDMTVILLMAAFITLVIPAIMILKCHFYHNTMKYLVVTATAIMAMTAYALFTFQAVIIFVVPTIIAGFYINKRLLVFSGIVTTISVISAHIITGVYLCQPWIEPFSGMEAILRYGAMPRCIQYWGSFLLIFFMVDRYMQMILHTIPKEENLSRDIVTQQDEEEKAFELILQKLTEREKSVFMLMIGGYTNLQIADALCLSNGTVKNYISTIYEKLGTKERNTLIVKYNRFVKDNDQSHIKK